MLQSVLPKFEKFRNNLDGVAYMPVVAVKKDIQVREIENCTVCNDLLIVHFSIDNQLFSQIKSYTFCTGVQK